MFHEGRQIGPYKLSRRLGRGGFGEVWLGERHGKFATTQVAVKLPLDEQVDHLAIEHEAQLWAKASGHPNVLPIIEADEYDGQIVIVSEYAPDGSLEEWLKTHGKMPVEKAVEMTIQILDGLEFLHSRQIIHRDLKPANILLQGNTPRLADFGISRAMRTTAASQSQNISGTFAYMSPEALDGKRSVQTDIWSVGVNLYQFLTGTLPFPQKEPSVLFPAIIMREFAPLPDEIPQSLKNVIFRALAKLSENRYQTTGEMREDLRRVMRGETISDFIQSDQKQIFSNQQFPPTQSFPFSARGFQDDNETVVRSVSSFEHNYKRSNLNIWIYATLGLVLFAVIGVGIYFFSENISQNNFTANKSVGLNENLSSLQNIQSQNKNSSINSSADNNLNSNIKNATKSSEIERKSVRVILQAVYYMEDGREMSSHKLPVILYTSLNKMRANVDGDGKFAEVKFENVPCGEEVKIQISDSSYQPDYFIPVTYKRRISCDKPTVNLGKLVVKTKY